MSTVEKSWGNRLVAEQFYEKSGHFICYFATCIGKESFYHVSYIFKRKSWLQSRCFLRYNYLTLFQFFFLLDMRLIRKLALFDLFWNFYGSLLFNLRYDWASLEIFCTHMLKLIFLSISLSFLDAWRGFEVCSVLEAHLRLGLLMADRKRGIYCSLDLSFHPLQKVFI